MLSRVADSLYWLGRYLERAENYARFIDVNFNLSIDLPPDIKEQWDPLIVATGDKETFEKYFGKEYSRQNSILFLGFDERNPNSILSTIKSARENARIVRENLPRESWETLNDLFHFLKKQSVKKIWEDEDPKDLFKKIKAQIQLLSGISYDTIPRTQGWYFTKIGQYLERADKTSRILDVKYHFLLPKVEDVGSPLDYLHWAALLKSVSGYNAYRRKHGKIKPEAVVEYLVLDHYFPRSVFFSIREAERYLHEISDSKKSFSNKAEKEMGLLRSELEFSEVNDLTQTGLHEYLDKLQVRIIEISNAIYERYFKIQSNFTPEMQKQLQS